MDQFRKALPVPYESLLRQLDILSREDQIPLLLMFTEPWRSKFQLKPHMRRRISTLQWELWLQQMIFMHLRNHLVVMSEELDDIQSVAEGGAEPIIQVAVLFNAHGDLKDEEGSSYFGLLESCVTEFLATTVNRMIKPRLKKFCLDLERADLLLQGNPSELFDIFAFIKIVLWKLKDLKISKPNLTASVKKQMEILVDALNLAIINEGKWTILDENQTNFLVYFAPLVNIAATIVTLYWIDENDEVVLAMASSSLLKFNLVEAYIVLVKVMKPKNAPEILTMRETVRCFIELLLENLVDITEDIDGIEIDILEEGLIFWISLVIDPPPQLQVDARIDLLVGEFWIPLLIDTPPQQTSARICLPFLVGKAESLIRELFVEDDNHVPERREILFKEFLERINEAKRHVRHLQVEMRGLSGNNNVVPETNRMGFLDFLMGNLEKKFKEQTRMFPFEKGLIETVHNELLLLRPLLMDFFVSRDDDDDDDGEHRELREILIQASNVDYFTDLCLSSTVVPIWSILMHLSNAIEKIQFVKAEVSRIRQKIVKVGFLDEEEKIIDWLIAGKDGLDIVAIVGMPGQGKTNLAQRVFHDSRVRFHFHKYSWCHISQAYDIRRIQLDALDNLGELLPSKESNQDLADLLRKSLKGRRYLLVLDDIWDVKPWQELKESFPDDNNGSRILLTTRNHSIPSEAKPNCSSIVELNPLKEEDSWNLLVMKVFEGDCCPPTLSHIGKIIAKKCNGLPLSIVVIAGFLKKDKNVDSWKQMSERVKSLQVSSNNCMDMLELSYIHLPDYLKPCFLYFGAFQVGQVIHAKQLFQLWIAEGFVQNEFVAEGYLTDLVARSLVIVTQRSSRNGIKKCRIHDLLHHLCLSIAEKERFLLVSDVFERSSCCSHYRLCFLEKRRRRRREVPVLDSDSESKDVSCVRTLHFSSRGHHYRFLRAFKLVRVMDLSGALVTQKDFLDITQLIHLRFLAVACRFSIPLSIVNLFRLEVLRFRYANTPIALPVCLIEMTNLRHVFASPCTILSNSGEALLDLPFSPSILTNLQTLTEVVFLEESPFKSLAQKIPNVLKLGLVLSFPVLLTNYFKNLESLNLSIVTANRQLLEKTISPSTLDFPMTVKKLALTADAFILTGALLSSIGKLTNLEVLKLHAHFENDRWDVEDDEFLKLKYLEFVFSSIKTWNVSDESFPCLEQLLVKRCAQLEELPRRFGESYSLRRIEVINCNDRHSFLDSFQEIVDALLEKGNSDLQYSIS